MIKSFTRYMLAFSTLAYITPSSLLAQMTNANQLSIHWRTAQSYNGVDNLNYSLVLKNNSSERISLKNWELWFNSMFPAVHKEYLTHTINDLTGNLFKIQFHIKDIAPKDSLVLDYTSKYKVVNVSTAPNGFYLQHAIDKDKIITIDQVAYSNVIRSDQENHAFLEHLFERNASYEDPDKSLLILPTPARITIENGSFELPTRPKLNIDSRFDDQNVFFEEVLSTTTVKEGASDIYVSYDHTIKAEAYSLEINNTGVHIAASTSAGVFYALQSIRSMLSAKDLLAKQSKSLPYVSIKDEPRYGYRGFMMDISRNFKEKSIILKYLDLMATYKLNVFHFHFTDDEGWRIEIPGLPELTEIGATRSPYFHDGNSIAPAYGSGARTTKGEYLTKADFVEILKYAKARHITVVPELESPGHGRAAVKAMETRYHRYMKAGNKTEAEKYLLYDLEDKSVYNSAQNWTDNVMNPALPSVYTFVEKVIDELALMYQEAGLKLEKISLGGDEVPNGVWEKSPKIQELMKREGLQSVYDVWPYYVNKLNAICQAKGLKMAGWEEFGMVNKGEGMHENSVLANKQNMQLDVWNNMIGGGQEDLAYRLANAGYPTVLISASNVYFDMMWNDNFTEPGLKWATFADLHHAYSLLPEDFFANIDTYYSGKKLGKEHFNNHTRLTEVGKANFLGVKGGLWAETVHTEAALDYMVFPRFFALVERAWSPKRSYESETAFDSKMLDLDYIQFINKIGRNELPKLNRRVQYRLPAVGLKEKDGLVYANLEYPGFDIYYTEDGSIPSVNSSKYDSQKPVSLRKGSKLAFAVVDELGRVGQISYIKK